MASKNWYEVTVALLQEVIWRTSALEGLVMERSQKEMIHALVVQHKDSRGHPIDDFIDGKGQVSSGRIYQSSLCNKEMTGTGNRAPWESRSGKDFDRRKCGGIHTKTIPLHKHRRNER
jgi:hypothetical protein